MSVKSIFRRIWSCPVNVIKRVHFYLAWCLHLTYSVQREIHSYVALRFRRYGFFVARHPYSLILFSIVVFLITSYPLTEISWTEYPPLEFVESSLPALPTPTWFKGESSSVAVLLPISVSLTLQPRRTATKNRGSTTENAPVCSPLRTTALAADRLVSALSSSHSLPTPYSKSCYRLSSEKNAMESEQKDPLNFLPRMGECFVTAPLTTLESYQHLEDVFDRKKSNATPSELSIDLMFGMPFSSTGLQSLYVASKHAKHLCASAVGHSVHFIAFAFFAPVYQQQEAISKLHVELLHAISPDYDISDESISARSSSGVAYRPAFLYFRSWNWLEFFPILAIYIALLGYIYFSLTKIAMVKSKAGLALGIVYGIGASFLAAVGICTRLGLTFGYFFSVTDVFPYVVVLNGLENITIMTTAVTNCRRAFKCDVPLCIAMGLESEGFRMLKHICLAAFVSVIGVLTGVPQIRDFFLMSLIALCTDLLFQLVFFSAVLAIDIKRIELDEQIKRSHRRNRSLAMDVPVTITGPPEVAENAAPSSLAWFHARRFSTIGAVFAILFITILYLESYNGGVYYRTVITPLAGIFKPKGQLENVTDSVKIGRSPENSLASLWWRNLPRGYLQKLFTAAHGMSLTHRYLTILAPVELHAHVPLEPAAEPPLDSQFSLSGLARTESLALENAHTDEPISSQVLVVILVVLSFSVIVNLSLLLYTCLKRRFQPRANQRPPGFFTALDFVAPYKNPTRALRVASVANMKSSITAATSHRVVSPSAVIVHTTDGLLTVLDSVSGETLCQMKRSLSSSDFASTASNRPDLVEQSMMSSTLPCWALEASRETIYITGGTAAVELYSIIRDKTGSLNMSFKGVFSSNTTTAPIYNILGLPGDDLFAVSYADGCVEIVQWNKDGRFSTLQNIRMAGSLIMSVSGNLLAIGSSEGLVRILCVLQSQNAVSNCSTINIPPSDSDQTSHLSVVAIDSLEPAAVAIGKSDGHILLYELVPKYTSNSTCGVSNAMMAATHNLVFSGTMPRPLPQSFSKANSRNDSSILVRGISRLVMDANICIAISPTGSACVISRRRLPYVIVGSIHPNLSLAASHLVAPILDAAVVPSIDNATSEGGPGCSLFVSAHADGHALLWAVHDRFPLPTGVKLVCAAWAQSPIVSWPVERLFAVERTSDQSSQQIVFSVRNKICRIEVPLNVSYAN